jgi:hypothetical protein
MRPNINNFIGDVLNAMTGELVVADGTLLDEQYVADLEKNSIPDEHADPN